MWISNAVLEWFKISQETFTDLKVEVAALKTERDLLRADLLTTKANCQWVTQRINILEVERAQLLHKAYNIDVPVPEIVVQPRKAAEFNSALFDDIGNEQAKMLGLPVYD